MAMFFTYAIIYTFIFGLILIAYLYFTHDYNLSDITKDLSKELIFAFIIAGISTFLFEAFVQDILMDDIKKDVNDLIDGLEADRNLRDQKFDSFGRDVKDNLKLERDSRDAKIDKFTSDIKADLKSERDLRNEKTEEFLKEIRIDRELRDLNIVRIYQDRSDTRFRKDLIEILNQTDQGDICLLGISLNDFFDDNLNHKEKDQKNLYYSFSNCVNRDNTTVKVLFSNPYNKRTFGYRYIFEESEKFSDNIKNKTHITREFIDELLDESLYESDVKPDIEAMISNAINNYEKKIKVDKKMFVRLYNPHPLCFCLMINDVIFIEPYTFAGKGGLNIVVQVRKPSKLYDFYVNHFKCLWYISGYCGVEDKNKLAELREIRMNEENGSINKEASSVSVCHDQNRDKVTGA